MSTSKPLRVMWLLNHTAARKFEIPMLKKIGVEQIFLPKSFPADPGFRSASVDYSEDSFLQIPSSDLQILNSADWYGGTDKQPWILANQYFDIAFFILQKSAVLSSAAKYFKGAVLWRAYGLDKSISYGQQLAHFYQTKTIESIKNRFYFGEAYAHLADAEPANLKQRRIYLPLGLPESTLSSNWEGKEKAIYFVCPDIGFNPYYKAIYQEFSSNFAGTAYVIAGAQPVYVADPKVLGYVTQEQHTYNMEQYRVMFYHSQEPNHIHYHPFEAIRAGMPLVFMANGLLDRMGGINLLGRCQTIDEARTKIKRILSDDWGLIKQIRSSQTVLLEPMKPGNCEAAWRTGFARLNAELAAWRTESALRPVKIKRKKIAVILPSAYQGGTLRGALELAKALYFGSRTQNESADIVFVHPDDDTAYTDEDFAELPQEISLRRFNWKILPAAQALRAMRYAGDPDWQPSAESYIVPDDGMQQLMDCDLWVVISDRLSYPLLPIKPVVLMVFDYLQRYVDVLAGAEDTQFLAAARSAARVLVTTEFTRQDALQYAGASAHSVRKVPMLAPEFATQRTTAIQDGNKTPYFVWTTNAGLHKNHRNAAEALQIYYEELEGKFKCKVSGVNTKNLLTRETPQLLEMAKIFDSSKLLRKSVKFLGHLPNAQYQRLLSRANFLWHAAQIDNGTFSVIEAAWLGVPALSSDYPAMQEINNQFSLNLLWMNASEPRQMAVQLKNMETEAASQRRKLPSAAALRAQGIATHAVAYWREVSECL